MVNTELPTVVHVVWRVEKLFCWLYQQPSPTRTRRRKRFPYAKEARVKIKKKISVNKKNFVHTNKFICTSSTCEDELGPSLLLRHVSSRGMGVVSFAFYVNFCGAVSENFGEVRFCPLHNGNRLPQSGTHEGGRVMLLQTYVRLLKLPAAPTSQSHKQTSAQAVDGDVGVCGYVNTARRERCKIKQDNLPSPGGTPETGTCCHSGNDNI